MKLKQFNRFISILKKITHFRENFGGDNIKISVKEIFLLIIEINSQISFKELFFYFDEVLKLIILLIK